MAVYAAVSAALALQFLSLTRWRSVVLILSVAAVAGTSHQAARFVRSGDADVTTPVIALVTAFSVRVAKQWERGAVLRFGRYKGLRGPGLFFIIPINSSKLALILKDMISETSLSIISLFNFS